MPPKDGPRIAHAVDELVDVLGVDLEVDRIDVGEALEEHRLAFHHRLRGERAEIAEAEDGGAVGDDGDHVAARRVVEGACGVLGDRLHRHGDARRIGERQVALRRHRLGRVDLQLAGPALAWNSSASWSVTEGPDCSACPVTAMMSSNVPVGDASLVGAFVIVFYGAARG